jgi:hypothetical protein
MNHLDNTIEERTGAPSWSELVNIASLAKIEVHFDVVRDAANNRLTRQIQIQQSTKCIHTSINRLDDAIK